MIETFDIAGYTRISFEEEEAKDKDNTSIENQKAIIEDFVRHKFPGSRLTFYEDRDRSGYTFETREDYQRMRKAMMSHKIDILVVKDFSRFSRRNSRGLVELEDLRDAGIRIISIGDGIDYPNDDDWLKIQFQFLINEMPVTDTSKKVRNVIRRRQEDGKWICAAPYGYIVNLRQEFEVVPTEADVVRTVFRLYNEEGWGYKRIANYLTEEGIPTPRMSEKQRLDAIGKENRIKAKAEWSIVSVQGVLDNDFYIGTFRLRKYTRRKINGKDMKLDADENVVIENHHQAIIDYRTFATTRRLRELRSKSNYRGVKKYDNVYSGFLVCGDCASPMFSMSRSDMKPAYTCGTYHRRGRNGCTSHHIRVERLDCLLKMYVERVMKNASNMLQQLNSDLANEQENVQETEVSADNLAAVLQDYVAELKVTKRQRIRELMKYPENAELIEQTYDELEADLQKKIEGIRRQIDMLTDKRNTILRVNRAAKLAMDVFRDILDKEKLERNDLELIIQKICVYEDHMEIKLRSDIDQLIRCESLENVVNFKQGSMDILKTELVQSSFHRKDKVYAVNVISDGDPLEIFTEKDGEVIFKKYSPMGDLQVFAAQMCESIGKNTGHIAAVADRDSIIAVAGAPKRELLEKRNSPELEQIMEQRKSYRYRSGETRVHPAEAVERYHLGVAVPILAEGDLMGCVMLLLNENDAAPSESEQTLVQTVAGFLGRQMEN
ncbi:MAG: stage V sporulation protein T [Ruminococcaceae bacterium]|nr:stage V sporulation protein T [Oscillospiraceae bacterium]